MTESDIRLRFDAAVIALSARGVQTTRSLYADNAIWTAKEALGEAVCDRWLRAMLTPESEPPGKDTRWRMRESRS